MLKIAMVGGVSDFHGKAFAALYNGWDKEKYTQYNWPQLNYKDPLEARITKVWDPNREAAEKLADATGIDIVTATMEEAGEGVDGVIITDDLTMNHQKRAFHFIEQGIPTFIDKPLSTSLDEARALVNLAKEKGTLMMSTSALRYALESEDLRANPGLLGDILTAQATSSGGLIHYGIHPLEFLYPIMGAGITSVENIGDLDRNHVKLQYKDGRMAMLNVYKQIGYTIQMTLYGTKGWRLVQGNDGAYFYWNMHKHFLKMIQTKELAVPLEETLEIIAVLAAAEKSLEVGGPVQVNP